MAALVLQLQQREQRHSVRSGGGPKTRLATCHVFLSLHAAVQLLWEANPSEGCVRVV